MTVREHDGPIASAVCPVRREGLSGRVAIRTPSLIGLIVVLLALALWATPSAAMAHVHGPDAPVTETRAAPDHATPDCPMLGEPAHAGCRGLACCPGLALLPTPTSVAGSRPATPAPDRSALGTNLAPDILPPPPKA